MVSRWMVAVAFRLVWELVPGTTPKNPFSGLTAHSRPSGPGRSHAMSSPTVWIFQPFIEAGGVSIARFVLPQALGKAPQTYVISPSGLSIPTISMCSASQPSRRPTSLAIRSAMHFLERSALPP